MACVLNAVVRFLLPPFLTSKKIKCMEYLCIRNRLIERGSSAQRKGGTFRGYVVGIYETVEKGNKVWLFA